MRSLSTQSHNREIESRFWRPEFSRQCRTCELSRCEDRKLRIQLYRNLVSQLAGNQLSASSIYQFNVQHLSYLSNLDLSSNLLSGALSPPSLDLFPPNLRALDLSLNSISKISSHAFTSLSRLTSLSLEGNAVEKVEDKAFLGLTSLASLDLSHNSIVTLATDSLAGLPSLKHLNLAHNHLQVVPLMRPYINCKNVPCRWFPSPWSPTPPSSPLFS